MPGLGGGRWQYAVVWPATGYDDQGRVTRGSPVEVKVRWESTTGQVTLPNGNVVDTDATVKVDREILEGSLMRLGPLSDLYGTGTAVDDDPDNQLRVVGAESTPDFRGIETDRWVFLKRDVD